VRGTASAARSPGLRVGFEDAHAHWALASGSRQRAFRRFKSPDDRVLRQPQ